MIPIYRPDNLDEYLDEVMLIMIMMMVIIMMLVNITMILMVMIMIIIMLYWVGNICIYEWSMV